MGIKGIYGEIGNGRRISLSKLAAENIATHGRPLKIAVDISIWLFQIQASQGGASPAIRTLYFRLVRLLGLGIRPLFVFDGPNKPPFKRAALTSSAETSFTRPAKRLIHLFGFQHHTAPGEAEAECALLQKLGIVDMVLSEDIDTLTFGCTVTIRNWTAEGSRGSKAPTHVNMFTVREIKSGASGLDREGMILVALMNGGDYLPAGIPGCGIKLACEAARAGFGHDLCELSPDDTAGLNAWRERLCHELATNESGYFRTKHKALKIPEEFPDIPVLGYHAHPLVSSPEDLSELRTALAVEDDPDVKGLRDFVDEGFNWKHLSGAKRFLRQLAPSLLAHKLRQQAPLCKGTTELDEQTDREERLITDIGARRAHFSTDGISEMKVAFIPAYVVGLDLDHETTPEEEEQETSSDDEEERADGDDDKDRRDKSPTKKNLISTWDPWAADKTWIPEIIVRLGAPLSLERWDAYTKTDRPTEGKSRPKGKTVRGGMKTGAIDSYLRVAKPNPLTISQQQAMVREAFGEYYDNDVNAGWQKEQAQSKPSSTKQRPNQGHSSATRIGRRPPAKKSDFRGRPPSKVHPSSNTQSVNPWTLAQQRGVPGSGRALHTQGRYEDFDTDRSITPSFPINSLASENPVANGSGDGVVFPPGPAHSRPNQSTPSAKRAHVSTHVSTVIRKSLEGTWKGTNDLVDLSITPERLVSDVSLIDMTAE